MTDTEQLDSVLGQITESLVSTSESLDNLKRQYELIGKDDVGDGKNTAIRDMLGKDHQPEKVSLLSLKNASLLAYVSGLMVVIGEKLGQSDATASQGRQQTVEQRVTLERGVKPLEKKLAYQLDKLTRAYTRMETEYEQAHKRSLQRQELRQQSRDSGSEDGSDSDSEEEAESFRPNAAAMAAAAAKQSEEPESKFAESAEGSTYKPPKISAMLPPQHHFEDKFDAQQHKDRSGKSRMQAMEEYVKEMSEQPDWEASVGSNIINHGKGGIKTLRDSEKEQRVKNYEEDNFTRLNLKGNKAERRKAKQKERAARVNMIGGEDFSIFNSKRRLEDSTSRQNTKKPRNAWDRAKKRL